MVQFAFQPIRDDPANPTARLRSFEVTKALNRQGISAERLHNAVRSEVLVWSGRDWESNIERLRERHRWIVFDFTDNILAYPQRSTPLGRQLAYLGWRTHGRARVHRFLARFDALVVGSQWLRERVRSVYGGPVYVIEDGQDPIRGIMPTEGRTADALWVGMNNNIEYLFEVLGSIPELAGIELKVITSRRKSRRFRGTRSNEALAERLPCRAKFVEWRLGSHVREAAECRIGLAPLPLNDVTRAKTENKLLFYSALGIPFLASDIPSYRSYVERYGLGFICRTREDWVRNFRALTENEALWHDMSRRGPEVVREHYNMDVMAKKYIAMYEDLMGRAV